MRGGVGIAAPGDATGTECFGAPGGVAALTGGPHMAGTQPDGEWDRLALAHPDCSPFHLSGWANALRDAYGFRPRYLAASDARGPLGLLPLMEVRGVLGGRRGIALPFADACAPLLWRADAWPGMRSASLRMGHACGWKTLELRGGADDAAAVRRYTTHDLALTRDPRELWARLRGTVRTAVRKAEAAGVRVEVATSIGAVRAFYGLHALARREHGLPPQPFRFFRALHTHIIGRQGGFVALASRAGTVVAGVVFLHAGRRACYKYGAMDRRFQRLRASPLAMWEAIRHSSALGYEHLSFGRSDTEHEGLRRFKESWGAVESALNYVRYDVATGQALPGEATGPRWYNRIFRVLPVSVNRLIGAALYRHAA